MATTETPDPTVPETEIVVTQVDQTQPTPPPTPPPPHRRGTRSMGNENNRPLPGESAPNAGEAREAPGGAHRAPDSGRGGGSLGPDRRGPGPGDLTDAERRERARELARRNLALARARKAAKRKEQQQKPRTDAPRAAGAPPRFDGERKPQKSALDLIDTAALARQVQGWHAIGAHLLKLPELELTERESLALTQSAVELAKQYDLTLSPKAAAWLAFVATAGSVYGPRAISVARRAKAAKAAARAKPPEEAPKEI